MVLQESKNVFLKFFCNGYEYPHRYKIVCVQGSIMNKDGCEEPCILLHRYWRSDDGWEICSSNYEVYVSLETLMSKFILVDSPIDEQLKSLSDFKNKIQQEKLDESLAPFQLRSIEERTNCDDLNEDEQPIPSCN